MGTSPKPLPTMTRVLFLAVLAHVSIGAPLEGFGDATDAEIEEIRAGTYLEMFDENPTYNYNYKVADDAEQTYLSMDEARNDGVVTGTYSYVDPLGSLITVKYTAGAMGYTEERSEQPGFVSINPRPVSSSSASSAALVSGGSAFSSSGSSGLSSSTGLSSGSSSLFSGGSSSLFSGSSSLSSGSPSQSSGSSSQTSGTSSSTSSNSLDQSSLVAQIISQIAPLVSQTVTSAVAGQSSNAGQSSTSLTSGQSSTSVSSDQDSLLILRPGSSSSSSSSSSADLIAQILAQIGPLVSQTVSSVVSSGSQTATIPRVSIPVPTASAPESRRLIASGSQDRESLFGSSGDAFNVKINHAGANIEY